jgi:hypothetical protein
LDAAEKKKNLGPAGNRIPIIQPEVQSLYLEMNGERHADDAPARSVSTPGVIYIDQCLMGWSTPEIITLCHSPSLSHPPDLAFFLQSLALHSGAAC